MRDAVQPAPGAVLRSQVLGCAVVKDIGRTADGIPAAELTAFCVHPLARGAGRGDSLLDFLEQARPTLVPLSIVRCSMC